MDSGLPKPINRANAALALCPSHILKYVIHISQYEAATLQKSYFQLQVTRHCVAIAPTFVEGEEWKHVVEVLLFATGDLLSKDSEKYSKWK